MAENVFDEMVLKAEPHKKEERRYPLGTYNDSVSDLGFGENDFASKL